MSSRSCAKDLSDEGTLLVDNVSHFYLSNLIKHNLHHTTLRQASSSGVTVEKQSS